MDCRHITVLIRELSRIQQHEPDDFPFFLPSTPYVKFPVTVLESLR